jgi:hypothetical protein
MSTTSGLFNLHNKKDQELDELRGLANAALEGNFPELSVLLFTMLLEPNDVKISLDKLEESKLLSFQQGIIATGSKGYQQLLKYLED